MSLMRITAVKSSWMPAGVQWINPDHIHRIMEAKPDKAFTTMKAQIMMSADSNDLIRVEETVEELLALYDTAKLSGVRMGDTPDTVELNAHPNRDTETHPEGADSRRKRHHPSDRDGSSD